MNNYSMLYLGTIIMILLSLALIFLVVWTSTIISEQTRANAIKENHWQDRIEAIEQLVKSEFINILSEIKKEKL